MYANVCSLTPLLKFTMLSVHDSVLRIDPQYVHCITVYGKLPQLTLYTCLSLLKPETFLVCKPAHCSYLLYLFMTCPSPYVWKHKYVFNCTGSQNTRKH
jgi:hypothetical protein